MNNIFENAKLGDVFVCKNDDKLVFLFTHDDSYAELLDWNGIGSDYTYMYNLDGTDNQDDEHTIVKKVGNVFLNDVLLVLDDMFMEQSNISVDDWFRDEPNLFQGRETFIKRMMGE